MARQKKVKTQLEEELDKLEPTTEPANSEEDAGEGSEEEVSEGAEEEDVSEETTEEKVEDAPETTEATEVVKAKRSPAKEGVKAPPAKATPIYRLQGRSRVSVATEGRR